MNHCRSVFQSSVHEHYFTRSKIKTSDALKRRHRARLHRLCPLLACVDSRAPVRPRPCRWLRPKCCELLLLSICSLPPFPSASCRPRELVLRPPRLSSSPSFPASPRPTACTTRRGTHPARCRTKPHAQLSPEQQLRCASAVARGHRRLSAGLTPIRLVLMTPTWRD